MMHRRKRPPFFLPTGGVDSSTLKLDDNNMIIGEGLLFSPPSAIVVGGGAVQRSPLLSSSKIAASSSSLSPTISTTTTMTLENKTTMPTMAITMTNAGFYILSGCSQPLIMTLCKTAGIADSSCQLYMFFYALGPALVMIPLVLWEKEGSSKSQQWPTTNKVIFQAAGICIFDIFATVMNYTGAALAGPTIFAIVYSSVTIWTALFSQLLLRRPLDIIQWMTILIVFSGLVLTTSDSLELGDDVIHGLMLLLIGSAMHALTYIMSEGIMTITNETLSSHQNNAIQSTVAASSLLVWQIIYTLPRWEEKIGQPMREAGTSPIQALGILSLFAISNVIHSSTFFHTLRFFPGGSTSAGVMKALQAVLVFVMTHFAFCGQTGGEEMCFTRTKFLSLLTVTGGVLGYGIATQRQQRQQHQASSSSSSSSSHYYYPNTTTANYEPIKDDVVVHHHAQLDMEQHHIS